jgi:DNA-binding FrmR family transcriptional regulator
MTPQVSTDHLTHGTAEVRAKAAARLRSVEGHVRGVQRMVDEGAYCVDIIKQTQAIQRALDKVSALLLEDHLKHCASTAIRAADPTDRERTIQELLEVFETSAKL